MDLKAKITKIIIDNSSQNDDYERCLDTRQLTKVVNKIAELINKNNNHSDKGKWFRCINGDISEGAFIEGNKYKCVIHEFQGVKAFINEFGQPDGWGWKNYLHFQRVEK